MRCKKRSFDVQTEADAFLAIAGPSLADFTMTSYKCRKCKMWHIGHSSPELKESAKRAIVERNNNNVRSRRGREKKLTRPKQLKPK
jgi:hypothetical protein